MAPGSVIDDPAGFDRRVRLTTYRHFVDSGAAPTPAELAAPLATTAEAVQEAWARLAAEHVLALQPGTGALWMAMPFSAVPTGFRVHAAGRSWWANCAWDALGIPAMLGVPARIDATCGDCTDPMVIETGDGGPARGAGVVHFAVPARNWWDDIGFT